MTWTPAGAADLQMWFDASGQSAGAVSQWDDLSGNGYHVTQGTGANQPAFVESVLNGMSVLRFDGSDNLISADTNPLLGVVAGFIVFRTTNITNRQGIITKRSSNTAFNDFEWRYGIRETNAGTDGRIELSAYASSSDETLLATNACVNNTWVMDGFFTLLIDDEDDFQGKIILRRDGSGNNSDVAPKNIHTAVKNATNRINIGASKPGTQYFSGDIAEIVVFAGSLDWDFVKKMEGYLAWKWGLEANLPIGHPYETAAPQSNTASVTLTGFPVSASGINVTVRVDGESAPFYYVTGQSANGSGELAIAATGCPLATGTRTVLITCDNTDGTAGGLSNNHRAFHDYVEVTVS